MDSSTSHSNGWLPRQAIALGAVALSAWLISALFSGPLNPEAAFYSSAEALKNAWAQKMTRQFGAKVVAVGGSSCAFSIDGERMLEKFHLPTVNFGRGAILGGTVMIEATLPCLQRGDTLVLAFEPGILTAPMADTSDAVQFSFLQRHPEWAMNPTFGVGRVNWFDYIAMLRPGGYHAFTILGKLAAGRPMLRYKTSDFRPSGWIQTDVRVPIPVPAINTNLLSSDAVLFLTRLRSWCQERGIRAVYSMPWSYAPSSALHEYQRQNVRYLLQIAAILPVLRDPRLGADAHVEDFADTIFHLVTPAAELHSDELARQIINWDVWSVEELKNLEKTL